MRVVFLIKPVTEDGACSNLHKTNAKVSVRLYSNLCLASCQFNFALSESFCLDISSFCYLGLLTQVSGKGSPSLLHSGLLALSSGACCSPDAVFFLVPFWLCHSWCRWGWWCWMWLAPAAPVWRAASLLRARQLSDLSFP